MVLRTGSVPFWKSEPLGVPSPRVWGTRAGGFRCGAANNGNGEGSKSRRGRYGQECHLQDGLGALERAVMPGDELEPIARSGPALAEVAAEMSEIFARAG